MEISVKPGYKFGMVAVPDSRGGPCPTALLELEPPFAASRALPAEALKTWKENIGRFHADELRETTLFLWALRPSDSPDILDGENRHLGRQAYHLFLGVLLAVPFYSAGRLTLITGANSGGRVAARSLTSYARSYNAVGAPNSDVSVGRLKLAAKLAQNILDHDKTPSSTRMNRAIRAFRMGEESAPLDFRLHQFVRCCEAFALPWNALEFAERLSRLCAGRSKQELRQIYGIRSGVEHLHGPYARLPKRLSKRARHERLVIRCVQAEALARFLLVTYLSEPMLWPHFESKATVKSFWGRGEASLREVWPGRIALSQLARELDWEAVESAFDNE